MGFTVEQASATRRVLYWLGTDGTKPNTLTDERVTADLLVLAKAANARLLMSTDAEALRAAVSKVDSLIWPVAAPAAAESVDGSESTTGKPGHGGHKFAPGVRVRVVPDPMGEETYQLTSWQLRPQRTYEGVVERCVEDAPYAPTPKYHIKIANKDDPIVGTVVDAFEHQMTVVATTRSLVAAFNVCRQKKESAPA